MEETEEYQKIKESMLRRKSLAQEKLQEAIERYKKIKESDVDKKEVKLRIIKNSIIRAQRIAISLEEQLELIRPEKKEDVEYRKRQGDEFAKKIQRVVPDNLPLRFHGCTINTAKHILESGEISSSVDRLGYETSYDIEGQISVTTKESIDVTIYSYAYLYSELYLPAGCIFVLLPKDEEDEKAGESMLMRNVDFKSEPNRLYGIITTPENLERIRIWGEKFQIDLRTKIYDYDSFIKSFEKEQEINEER